MAKIITKETKPGKGISKNEPEKRRFFLFFELFFAKIGKLMQLNLIYTIAITPLLAGLFFSFDFNRNITSIQDFTKMQMFTFAPDYISLFLLITSVFITGPATAGFVFVLRNIQRREHAWIFSDFWAQFKKNYRQGVVVGLIDLIVYLALYIAFGFYTFVMPIEMAQMGTFIPSIASGIIVAITAVFTWAHFYIYTMMVTFELKTKDLFKNAFIFALGKMPLNLFITAILAVIFVACVYLFAFSTALLAIVLGLFGISLIGFIIVFSSYPTIDKLMLKKAQEQNKRVLKY